MPSTRKLDIFLFVTAIVVLIIIAASYVRKTPIELPRRVNISLSPQCIDLFGSDIITALIQEFEERNPDLRIQMAEADQEADIIFFDDEEFNGLINASALAALSPYIHSEAQRDGRALPLVSFMDIFVYNVDILQAANCDRPPKTRAEFLATARAVAGSAASREAAASEEAVFPFALGLSQTDPMALRWNFYPWFWADGGDTAEIDASDKIALDTIAFLKQLNSERLLAPGTFEKDKAQRLQEFAEGKIAMMTASARDIALWERNTNGITFGLTALPAATLGKNRLGLSSIYAGISSACTLPDEAWIFLAFVAEKKQILAEALGAVPGAVPDTGNGSFPGTFPGEYIEKNPVYSKAWDIFETADIIEYRPDHQSDENSGMIRMKLTEALK